MKLRWLRSAALLFVAAAARPTSAQSYPPGEAAGRMTVPADLEVELVASEPLVRQPVAIDFDDRGRLWVIQYLQYPNPAGLKRVKVDRWSRTVYDRVPRPPPHGPRGADRITILEDLDGDRRADRAVDFVRGLNLATGFAFGRGGVFVLNVPYLLFYADENRDDIPDGDPAVLLEGFGMHDAHSVANSLTWGPDGWLYGTQGSTVTSRIREIEFQQGVWRYHPVTRAFELFCEGGGNSWGLDFDPEGNLFYSTNVGGFVALHGVQGGYYWKSFAKHGDLHNPYAFGHLEHVRHEGFRGGHVSLGGLLYEADVLPERYRGRYVAADLLGHGIYWHDVLREGSSFRSRHAGELLLANDRSFAPSDMTLGPDGALYVADWHDERTAHPDPDAQWDRTNGRIFRIGPARRGSGVRRHVDPNDLSTGELIGRLGHSSVWHVRRAQRLLAERRDPAALAALRGLTLETGDDRLALRALWALYAAGGFDAEIAAALLEHRSPSVRAWCVRFVAESGNVPSDLVARLIRLAASDPSAAVRSQLACSARRLPADVGLPILHRILLRGEDSDDPHLPLLLWWGVEAHAIGAVRLVEKLFLSEEALSASMVRDVVLERLIRRYVAEGTDRACIAAARLLEAAPAAPGARERWLVAIEKGLEGPPAVRGFGTGSLFSGLGVEERTGSGAHHVSRHIPEELARPLRDLWCERPRDPTLISIHARLAVREAQELTVALAASRDEDPETRRSMLRLLSECGDARIVPALLELVGTEKDASVLTAVMDALGGFDDPSIADAVLARYLQLAPTLRERARRLLFGRRRWARRYLEEIGRGRLDASEVDVRELQTVALHEDEELDRLVRKHWGHVTRGTPEERLAEMRRLRNDLNAGRGDASAGRGVFRRLCATCHLLDGEGARVGPDLTHANRQDRDYLLASIVDPSRVIRREHEASVVVMTDGRVLTGLVVEQTPAALTLLDARGERLRVETGGVSRVRTSPASLMPEDLLRDLSARELRDLFTFLETAPPTSDAPREKKM